MHLIAIRKQLIALLLIATCCSGVFGQESELRDVQDLAKDAFWGDGLHRFEYTSNFLQNGAKGSSREVIEFDGEFGKRVIVRLDDLSNGEEYVTVANPEYAFQLTRPSEGKPWMLSKFETRTNATARVGPRASLEEAWDRIRNVPYTSGGGIRWNMWLDDFQVSASKPEAGSLEITGKMLKEGGGPLGFIDDLRILVDSQTGMVEEYELSEAGAVRISGSCSLEDGESGGFTWRESAKIPGQSNEILNSISDMEVSRRLQSDTSDFYLSAYGFPEPELGGGGKFTTLLWFAVGVCLVSGAVYFAMFRYRRT